MVQDVATRTAFWLDLAWPEPRIGIEYEGEPHTEPARVLRDIARTTRLVDLGWRVYRYTKRELYGEPDRIVAELDPSTARDRRERGFPAAEARSRRSRQLPCSAARTSRAMSACRSRARSTTACIQ